MAGYDWSYWREKYVSGTDALTLEAVSVIPGAPSLPTLKRRSTKEAWAEQRKQFRYQVDTMVSTKDTALPICLSIDHYLRKVRLPADEPEFCDRYFPARHRSNLYKFC